jgi:hypothetical protein
VHSIAPNGLSPSLIGIGQAEISNVIQILLLNFGFSREIHSCEQISDGIALIISALSEDGRSKYEVHNCVMDRESQIIALGVQ